MHQEIAPVHQEIAKILTQPFGVLGTVKKIDRPFDSPWWQDSTPCKHLHLEAFALTTPPRGLLPMALCFLFYPILFLHSEPTENLPWPSARIRSPQLRLASLCFKQITMRAIADLGPITYT